MKKMMLILAILLPMLALPVTADNITVTADVPPYVSAVFNYNTVNFGTVQPGSTDVPAPGQEYGIYNVTLSANVNVNVIAYRTDWSPFEGLTLKFGDTTTLTIAGTPDLKPMVTLGTAPQIVSYYPVVYSVTDYHGYWLTVPATQVAARYSTTVTITYQPA